MTGSLDEDYYKRLAADRGEAVARLSAEIEQLRSRLSSATQELAAHKRLNKNLEAESVAVYAELAAVKAQVFARDVSVSPVALPGTTKESL